MPDLNYHSTGERSPGSGDAKQAWHAPVLTVLGDMRTLTELNPAGVGGFDNANQTAQS